MNHSMSTLDVRSKPARQDRSQPRSVIVMVSVLAAIAAIWATSSAASPKAASPIKYEFTLGTQGSNFPIYLGQIRRFFKREGVNVKLVTISLPSALYAGLAGGDLDAILTPPNIIHAQNANRQGGDRFVYFQEFQGIDLQLLQGPNANLPTADRDGFAAAVQGLKGKTIGLPAFGGITDVILRQILRVGGLDPNRDVNFVQIAYGPPALAALKSGRVDAYPFDGSFTALGVADDGDRVIFESGANSRIPESLQLNQMMYSGYASVKSHILENRPMFEAFNRAFLATKRFMLDPKNTPAIAKVAQAALGYQSAATADLFVKRYLSPLTRTISCRSLGAAYTRLLAFGVIQAPLPRCSDLYVNVSAKSTPK